VQLPGFVHRDELASYYALADCFVFPTHSDPWGLVVNEAMACGLPVICSKAAGCTADLLETSGRVITHAKTTELAKKMKEIADDRSLREEMSVRSRRIILRYSPELCAAGIARAALLTNHTSMRSKEMGSHGTNSGLWPGSTPRPSDMVSVNGTSVGND
jgi:glycosyltransferase involved in cell wall biosynthesis